MRSLTVVLIVTLVLSAGAVVAAEREANQTTLWIYHLDQFVTTHPQLTAEQRAIVAEGRRLLQEGVLERLQSPVATESQAARKALDAFIARASASFTRGLYSEAFVRLERGPRAKPPLAATAMIPDCDCSPSDGNCGECVTGSCRVMPDGCGTFGTSICYGLCW